MKQLLFLLAIVISISCNAQKVQFESADGLLITADTYIQHEKTAPFILLFHQAGWSRGEYKDIALRLNYLGYNCMAIDQRSGGEVNDVVNLTHKLAIEKGLAVDFPDAIPDMLSAIAYAKKNYVEGKFILWGSSYSSALVLKIMGDQPDICDAGLSFAPGEYFERFEKPGNYITTSAQHITKPIFITSAKEEKDNWWDIYEQIPSKEKHFFLPKTTGNHGSRALWSKFDDSPQYWKAVEKYLEIVKK